MNSPFSDYVPQRFQFRIAPHMRWSHGCCLPLEAFEAWDVHVSVPGVGNRNGIMSHRKEDPSPEIIRLIDCRLDPDVEFQWIDDDFGWGGGVA